MEVRLKADPTYYTDLETAIAARGGLVIFRVDGGAPLQTRIEGRERAARNLYRIPVP